MLRQIRLLLPLAAALLSACGSAPEEGDREGVDEPVFPPGNQTDDRDPATAACLSGAEGTRPLEGVSVRQRIGDFTVEVASDSIAVFHARAGDRVLFATSEDGQWLQLWRGALEAEEHQGSFDVREGLSSSCEGPTIDEIRAGEGRLVLRGGFSAGANECADVDWGIELCEERDGHLAFRIASSEPTFDVTALRVASDAEERIYGLGEQFRHDRLDLKGAEVPILSQEGGVGRGRQPITAAVNAASAGSGGSESTTYYAAAHYLTNRLRSVFLENVEYAVFDFRQDERSELRVHAAEVRGRILQGDSPLELIERFTEYSGRMPPLPDWAHEGAIVALARDVEDSRAIVDELLSEGAELAAVWNQTWSGKVQTFIGEQVLWNWTLNEETHPGWREFVADLDEAGIRTLCYINPMLVSPDEPVDRDLFAEARANGYLVRDHTGDPYLFRATAFDVGMIDLTNDAARDWMRQVIVDEMVEGAGCSGWMADFAEALPFDAALDSGVDAAAFHNRYPVEWMRLNREAVEEAGGLGDLLVFNRSGSARSPAYSLLLWEGDQMTTWDRHDGLVSAMRGLINSGFSGVSLNHSDTGGYTSLSLEGVLGFEREGELLQRWTEMNAFTSVLRTHEGNQPDVNAQIYSSLDQRRHFARFTRVFRALHFYRKRLFLEAHQKGWPVVRHLWLHYPDDERAQTVDDQFLLGEQVLVAPIKNKCWTVPICPYNRSVYLPAGEWVHLWSGELYGEIDRGVEISVRAPIGEPAVFYRRSGDVGAQLVANLRDAGIEVPEGP